MDVMEEGIQRAWDVLSREVPGLVPHPYHKHFGCMPEPGKSALPIWRLRPPEWESFPADGWRSVPWVADLGEGMDGLLYVAFPAGCGLIDGDSGRPARGPHGEPWEVWGTNQECPGRAWACRYATDAAGLAGLAKDVALALEGVRAEIGRRRGFWDPYYRG